MYAVMLKQLKSTSSQHPPHSTFCPFTTFCHYDIDHINSCLHPLNILPTQRLSHILPTLNMLCSAHILVSVMLIFRQTALISTLSQHFPHSTFSPHLALNQLTKLLVFWEINSFQHSLNIFPTQHHPHTLPSA